MVDISGASQADNFPLDSNSGNDDELNISLDSEVSTVDDSNVDIEVTKQFNPDCKSSAACDIYW